MPGNKSVLAVGVLAAVFFLQSLFSSLDKSPTGDEPYHIAAALSYIETGRILVNRQHPPLLKEISGLFLREAGVRWPSSPEADALLLGVESEAMSVGSAIIAGQGPDHVLFWARLPFILLGTIFVFVLYGFGRRLVGDAAALGAVFLYVLDLAILAHSYTVNTDFGLAFFLVVFLWALWGYIERPGLLRLIGCGVALGAALGAKFSAIAMLPVAALLLFAAAEFPVKERHAANPCSLPLPLPPADVLPRRLMHYGLALAGMGIVAFAFLQYIYWLPENLLQYIDGLHLVNADHNPDFKFMMAGRYEHRFYSYFLVAWLIKEPLAGILAAITGAVIAVRGRSTARLARFFLFVPAAALFICYTLYADDMGIRYMIPVLPFAFLLGGVGLAALFQSAQGWQRAAGAVLCIWLVVADVGIYPDHLSYFNEAACVADNPAKIGFDGGSRCGISWLDQSNIDWGQGFKQLKTWLDRNVPGKPVHYASFVAVYFPPEAYGIKTLPTDYADVMSGTKPGLYALSAQLVARARNVPGGGLWLRQRAPIAIAGHSIYIFSIPEK